MDHDESVLVAELASLNTGIARFILGRLDADAGRASGMSPTAEHALGVRLVTVGQLLQRHAAERGARVVPGDVTNPAEPPSSSGP